MLIWIFQTAEPLHSDNYKERPMRAINLTSALIKNGHKVVIWSSAFYHQEKRHRSKVFQSIEFNPNITINLIPSLGYKSNLGIKRLLDHAILAINLFKELNNFKGLLPDVAFVGYPPIEFSYAAAIWLKKNKIPYVLDVKDQWPHIFLTRLPNIIRPFFKLIFFPYFFIAKKVFSKATSISSISEPFLKWSLKLSERKKNYNDFIFYLSPPRIQYNTNLINSYYEKKCKKLFILKENKNKNFLFVGNFMKTAFDFNPIIEAAEYSNQNNLDWRFILCGNGDSWNEFKQKSKNLKNIILLGRVDFKELKYISGFCSLGIAPIKNNPDYLISIPNKILDYIALELPVITSLSGIVKELIIKNEIGQFFEINENYSLIKALQIYQKDPKKIIEHRKNCIRLYKNKFNHEKIYEKAIEKITGIA